MAKLLDVPERQRALLGRRRLISALTLLSQLACGDDSAAVHDSSSGDASTSAASGTTTTSESSADGDASSAGDGSSSSGATTTGLADSSSGAESSTTDGTGTTGEAMPNADALFVADGIARIDLTLGQPAINALWADPESYVHADAVIELADGDVLVLPDIGVRLKGRYGSFRNLDQKAAFLLRFDEYDEDQEPLGLEKLALNNMVQDPSMIHEQLAFAMFRDAGVAAPRSSYARVFVNEELYGLYATVEPPDNSEFLDGWFGNDDANLYEGEYGSDLYSGWGPSFDLDNGADVDFADLEEVAAALDAMVDPDTFVDDADGVIEIDRYLQFAATEIFIGHWDGYAWTRNNYFIYRAADGRWSFMPWGTDQTFSDYLPIWGGQGRIEQMCGASLPCRQLLADAFADVGDRVTTLGLVDRCDELLALIDTAMQEDPRKEYSADTVYAAVAATQDFLTNRPQDVEDQFACTDPSAVDDDADGASGCGFDCNDGDPQIHPGAPEQCNVVDDDCNGMLDDDPMCPACSTVPANNGGRLAYCFQPLGFAEAEADCVIQGGHLASIHDQATQDEIVTGAYAILGGLWWIGLSDSVVEGTFAWSDGTPLDYASWAPGEPNDYNAAEDCAHLADWAGGAWNDLDCGASQPYVCSLP